MNCPKCGAELDNLTYCPVCKFNILIYIKTRTISANLYNLGLEQANNGDFSSAIESLNKSVKFNKMNYLARNVLGLVYYEVGEVGKALKQWVISSSLVKENNLAKEYIDTVQNSSRKLDKYDNAIKMYNQALIYANQKSEDMAIIQLKKALELNPNFLEACNLLTLCYMNIKENDKALLCIEKALEIDISNPKALKYYKELKQTTQRNLKLDKTAKPQQATKYTTTLQTEKKLNLKTQAFSQIAGFAVGAVLTILVMSILVIPSLNEKSSDANKLAYEELKKLQQQFDNTINENDKAITQLKAENQKLSDQNNSLNQSLIEKENIQKVFQASALYDNGNKEEAANLLQSLTSIEASFPEETKALYESLKSKIYPEVARTYYNDGYNKYNQKNYDEARSLLEKSYTLLRDQSFSDDALYYIARIDETNGNSENAKTLYKRLMDDYPKSNLFYYAKQRLANLG